MKWRELKDSELEEIIGGEFYTPLTFMGIVSVLAILVTIYKIYTSSKGKAKFGNDYTFEWS